MLHADIKTRILSATAALLVNAIVPDAIVAAPTLQSVSVTPSAASISVGQAQLFKATGTFSNGSTHVLGPAIRDIAPGSWETCVLLTRGGVRCWGGSSVMPRRVEGITKATAVAFHYWHGCVVLARGPVQCWGSNNYGQLGNGTQTSSSSGVFATGIEAATSVGVGWAHSCAALADGKVQCWGYNYHGVLGDGTDALISSVPVSVIGINTATAVAVGSFHNCALLASGAVQCWGLNQAGQLGNGTTTDSNAPVTVRGISDATAVAAGMYFSCALLASGAVQCWGDGGSAQLGNGSSWPYPSSSVPVSVTGINTAVAITVGGMHACAVLSGGAVRCWGRNEFGQLGNGLMTDEASSTPVKVSGLVSPVRLAAGGEHTCALLSDGAMSCWGLDDRGQLGDRRRSGEKPRRWPVNVIGTPGVTWRSSDRSKATVGEGGRATARSIGNATITATTAGFINDNAVLTVK